MAITVNIENVFHQYLRDLGIVQDETVAPVDPGLIYRWYYNLIYTRMVRTFVGRLDWDHSHPGFFLVRMIPPLVGLCKQKKPVTNICLQI